MSPVVEIRSKRWASLILLPFILFLVVIFTWFVFGDGAESGEESPTFVLKVVAVFVIAVGTFLFVYFFKMTLNPVVILRVDEEGFVQNMGVDTGLIRWEEIEKMKVESINVTTNNGMQKTVVIGVYLKDPKAFRNRYNVFLRGALAANERLRGATFYIPYSYVSGNFEAFKELVVRKCGELEIEN